MAHHRQPFSHIKLITCAHPDCDRLPNGIHGHCCVRCRDWHEQAAKPAHTNDCDTLHTLAESRAVILDSNKTMRG